MNELPEQYLEELIKNYINYINSFIELKLIELIVFGCECGAIELKDFTVCYEEPCKFLHILCENCGKKHYIKEVTDFQEKIGI